MSEKCCAPNYEAMYNEERDKVIRFRERCAALELDLKNEREQRLILEAQMEVVRLIFGGGGK